MVPQGNGVRSALLQALAAGRGTNRGGPMERVSSRFGNGVPQQARLQALMERLHPGNSRPQPSMHQTGGNNDPLSNALGHTRQPETPNASMIDLQGGRPEQENSRNFPGGPGRQVHPDISPIMELLSGVDPQHFPELLEHISQLVASQGASGAPVGPLGGPNHGGPVQY